MFRTSAEDGRAVLWQAALIVALVAAVAVAAHQAASNLETRGIASGFDYLARPAGFEISPGPLAYSSRDPYTHALVLGLLNTLRVSALGTLFATVLGLSIGLARLSRLRVVSIASRWYVEAVRNTPLLLQLLFWYAVSQRLPQTEAAWNPAPGVFLSRRGLFLPHLAWLGHRPLLERPVLGRYDFEGGLAVTPEFAVLLLGLSIYTAAFIAEIVRGGVLAVDKGQFEAAAALGLPRWNTLRLVIFPQAFPVIVPPLVTQFLNLAKNSSLAVAIGYPDLMSITNTTLNQTGQAIEALGIATALYLGIGFLVSLIVTRHLGVAVHGA